MIDNTIRCDNCHSCVRHSSFPRVGTVDVHQRRTDSWPDGRAEIVVIGGGPGGYPAAFDAADRGMDVTLVNDEAIPGGVCLHRGCIPSKALLHVAKP